MPSLNTLSTCPFTRFVYKYSFKNFPFTLFTTPQSLIFTDFPCKLICLLSSQQKLVNRICKRRLKNFFLVFQFHLFWYNFTLLIPQMDLLYFSAVFGIRSYPSLSAILSAYHIQQICGRKLSPSQQCYGS